MNSLNNRSLQLLLSALVDQVGLRSTLHTNAAKVEETLRARPAERRNPLGGGMMERVVITWGMYTDDVDTPSARGAVYQEHQSKT